MDIKLRDLLWGMFAFIPSSVALIWWAAHPSIAHWFLAGLGNIPLVWWESIHLDDSPSSLLGITTVAVLGGPLIWARTFMAVIFLGVFGLGYVLSKGAQRISTTHGWAYFWGTVTALNALPRLSNNTGSRSLPADSFLISAQREVDDIVPSKGDD